VVKVVPPLIALIAQEEVLAYDADILDDANDDETWDDVICCTILIANDEVSA